MNRIDLGGRRAVVTGGAQGIGRAVAERLIASDARVTIWDVDRALGAETAADIGAGFVAVDLSDWDAVVAATDQTAADDGRDRHSRQQCRHRRGEYDPRGLSCRRMAARSRDRPRRRFPLPEGGDAADDRPRLWADRQCRLDRRQGGQPQCLRLFRGQGRRDRADEVARQGACRATTSQSTA